MIEVRDLRIGNYVEHHKYGVCIVCRIGEYMPVGLLPEYKVDTLYDLPKGINPIPLTEQWLKDFGFEIHSDYDFRNYYLRDGFYISMWMLDKPCAGFEEKGKFYWGDSFKKIEYVHQFQNLYYALRGQELKKR